MEDNFPIRKDSIEELIGHRNRALELARQGFVMLREAESAAAMSSPHLVSAGFLGEMDVRGINYVEEDEFVKRVRSVLDRHAWQSLKKLSGLRNMMDTRTHEDFDRQLAKDPPEFTLANITSTFMQLSIDAPDILARSIVNVFESFNTKRFVTNSAFKLGPRVIMTSALATWKYGSGWNSYGYCFNLVGDMDRLFHTLDGKKPPEGANAADTIGYAHTKREKTCQTDYFECRMFGGNGNLHIKFRRTDLVDKVNAILAKHYGVTLPDDTKERRP